jgi:hypothetical protein
LPLALIAGFCIGDRASEKVQLFIAFARERRVK